MFDTANSQDITTFIVTVDTEADNEWERQGSPAYHNIRALPAFQDLCDRYGVRPTYLVTYDVAADRDSLAVLRELYQDGNCEIGAHMHAWRTPPFYSPLDDGNRCHAYLYEYPRDVQANKVTTLTDHLERLFQTKITSHRGGRWGIDAYGMSLLEANEYEVDTSVTPFRSWTHKKGDPAGKGGPDFLRAPCRPYFPASHDVQRVGTAGILEVPVSVRVLGLTLKTDWSRGLAGLFSGVGFTKRKVRNILRKLSIAELVGLNPAVNPSRHMILLCGRLIREQEPVLNMAFHSSELIAGGSPEVADSNDQERLWRALDQVFACISEYPHVQKHTLTEYARQYEESKTG